MYIQYFAKKKKKVKIKLKKTFSVPITNSGCAV